MPSKKKTMKTASCELVPADDYYHCWKMVDSETGSRIGFFKTKDDAKTYAADNGIEITKWIIDILH